MVRFKEKARTIKSKFMHLINLITVFEYYFVFYSIRNYSHKIYHIDEARITYILVAHALIYTYL